MADKRSKILLSKCLSCCFPVGRGGDLGAGADGGAGRRLVRSSSAWLRSEIPELKEKCRGLIARICRRTVRRRSADFRYDPLSYAMNFDDGDDGSFGEGDSRYRSFSSRLAPPPVPAAAEIACG